VPAADYAGTPYSPRAAPGTLSLPASLTLPGNAQIFGTTFLPGSASYLAGPKPATCQAGLASADGGEIMTATSAADRSEGVTMIIRPGGAGLSTDLACPYIPAVRAADEVFRQGHVFCAHPSADVIRQIPTGTASLYAAAVLVPADVKDPGIQGSGVSPDPTAALFTAEVGQGAAAGQMIACTLPPTQAGTAQGGPAQEGAAQEGAAQEGAAQGGICAASLKFFLATQAQIRTRISAANLTRMQDALAAFLAEHDIR
jgi:hypothetical protein